jgi:NAD(P)H dehydrogenase (quinone)
MRILVVYCHPCAESFTAVIRDVATTALVSNGHELKIIDLYGEEFNPVMSADERRLYHEPEANEVNIASHLELLRWCEGLIFIYPTWCYGPPAMLKGWLDRVWVPHATFQMPERGKRIRRLLTNIRLIVAISTLGSPKWWWRFMNEPGRRMLLRGLGAMVSPRVRTRWLALHRMDSVAEYERKAFLDTVSHAMKKVK